MSDKTKQVGNISDSDMLRELSNEIILYQWIVRDYIKKFSKRLKLIHKNPNFNNDMNLKNMANANVVNKRYSGKDSNDKFTHLVEDIFTFNTLLENLVEDFNYKMNIEGITKLVRDDVLLRKVKEHQQLSIHELPHYDIVQLPNSGVTIVPEPVLARIERINKDISSSKIGDWHKFKDNKDIPDWLNDNSYLCFAEMGTNEELCNEGKKEGCIWLGQDGECVHKADYDKAMKYFYKTTIGGKKRKSVRKKRKSVRKKRKSSKKKRRKSKNKRH